MLDAPAVRSWCRDALDALGRAREEIDALNVYPVPDGDTGTNLYLTMESAVEEVDARLADDDLPSLLRGLARGALLGARGNSGVILSQLVRAAGEVHRGAPGRRAARHASQGAGSGLQMRPTRPSRSRSRARSCRWPGQRPTLPKPRRRQVHGRRRRRSRRPPARQPGARALDRTPELLEPLRRAGVVDAGGRGLTVLLDALVRAVTGEHPMSPPPRAALPQPRPSSQPDEPDDGPAFEVMFLLEADDAATAQLKETLEPLGDSLLVVGGDGLWNVHVHVDDVGAAVEAGMRAGRPYRIKVTHFGEQVVRTRGRGRDTARAVVAFAPGEGWQRWRASAGRHRRTGRPREQAGHEGRAGGDPGPTRRGRRTAQRLPTRCRSPRRRPSSRGPAAYASR